MVGTICHNDIARFHHRSVSRPTGHNTDLGVKNDGDVLSITFNNLDEVRDLLHQGGLQSAFRRSPQAVDNASLQGRQIASGGA